MTEFDATGPAPRITQRAVPHAGGELPDCSCGRPPRHIFDSRRVGAGGGHFLECCPCDRRTQRHPDLCRAVAEFCRLVGSRPPATARMQAVR